MSLPVLEILKHYKIGVVESDETNAKCLCPFHEDNTPSVSIHMETGVWNCFACSAKGNIYRLLARVSNVTERQVKDKLAVKFGIADDTTIKPDTIEQFHRAIGKRPEFLAELKKRGVTDQLITYYKIGYDRSKDRITIPIKNSAGFFIAIRRYRPGSEHNKVISEKYNGKNKLFPIEQLSFDTIVLTGGEIKAIVAAYWLNPSTNPIVMGAVSTTTGEGNLSVPLAKSFAGKVVYVCMDIDSAGVKATERVASVLVGIAKKVFVVKLPLNISVHPHGDINDFVQENEDNIDTSFLCKAILDNSELYTPKAVKKAAMVNSIPPIDVDLSHAVEGSYVGLRLRVKARVISIMEKTFNIPSKVKCNCDKSENFCNICPVFKTKNDTYSIPEESKSLISMCGAHESIQKDELKSAIGIPARCKVCSFEELEHYSIQEAHLDNILSMTQTSFSTGIQTAFCVGNNLQANSEYTFTGRNYPHQRDQSSSFIFSSYDTLEDELSTYKAKRLDDLHIFNPEEWTKESILTKLHDIYEDLEANVTYIYKRRRLHMVMDLVYHSPLQFELDDKLQKGWAECLIIGDSSIGKTETSSRLRDHYGLGKRVSCEGATVPGLMGGCSNTGNGRFFTTWGVIPMYDKQLVILEELSGVREGTLQSLTDMRSTGIAAITKIERREAHARTRLIAISNPKTGQTVSSYRYGIQAIEELIKTNADIRRFDIFLVESQQEINMEELAQLQSYRPQVKHRYTSDLCRELILWGWTRDYTQVVFEDGCGELLGKESVKLCDAFDETCPIIDKGSIRYKLARLAASLAVRTFSNINNEDVLVRKCHIAAISMLLYNIYSKTTIGYLDYSEAIRYQNNIRDPISIKRQIKELPAPTDFCDKLLHAYLIDVNDIADWTSYDQVGARRVISLMVRKNAFIREGTATYRKNLALDKILKELKTNGELVG